MEKRIVVFLIMLGFLCFTEVKGQNRKKGYTLESDVIKTTITQEGITSLTSPEDPYEANVISEVWKRPVLKYKILEGDWLEMYRRSRQMILNPDSSVSIVDYEPGMPQKMETRYSLNEKGLDIDITIESMMKWSFTIGDLYLSLPVKRPGSGEPQYIFEECYTTHRYITGNGSFLFYARPSGRPPFLMVLPKEGTKLEYLEGSEYFIHSFLSGNKVECGTWRQEHTKCVVGSADSDNSKVEYGFKLRWTDSWDGMRQLLYEEGLFDIHVVPGMSVPNNLTARFALHTKNTIDSVTAEFPSETSITFLGENLPDYFVYEVQFSKLGENMLTIHYNDAQKTYLEFFSTEPIETLIKKRASFIVNRQQHRDPSKWYNGLFSAYDMSNSILRSPDDTDGFDYWWGYVLACDDPALCKAPFIAAKNVYFPVDSEIEAVEYYIENFVWDKLQRTDKDCPYPYGIYGVPNWKVARDIDARTGVRSRQLDRMQVWRSYDYPHIFMMYYHMYQIAKMYPEKVHYLDAEGYLERAFMTARGFFLYPYEIWGEYYKAYEIGCYNELVIEDIIQALEENNRQKDADWLRSEYEKKVKYFIYDNKYPYRSEYSFDRTAFESTYAFARYGALNTMKSDTNLWYDKIREVWYSHSDVIKTDALDFMERQLYAGLTVRGWLETTYYQLGADGSMSYMAKMGGWSILDYGKYFAKDPYPWLRLGYASYLSSWALMNTGTEESNYGFWAPGKVNDGAMGWAFMSSKRGRAWIRKEYDRGAWMYDGEADLGNGAAIRIAETILIDDPIFGWIAYGGILKKNTEGYSVIPRDGLRNRFSIITEKNRVSVELDRDGFVSEQEIIIERSLENLQFKIENRTGLRHTTRVKVFAPQSTVLNLTMDREFPCTPVLNEKKYPEPVVSIREISGSIEKKIGNFIVKVLPDPLRIIIRNNQEILIQELTFLEEGQLAFKLDDQPVLGLGEGGPRMGEDWRNARVEFDRRGRLHKMQPHRTLEDDSQMVEIVKTFREKQIPLDAVIYLGTGFCPRGWNTEQPSFDFNPEVFTRNPSGVIDDLHDLKVKVIVHMVPWDRDKLSTLQGSIPPEPDEELDESHIFTCWKQHIKLVNNGIDAWWPDEGDWFNLFERIKRHQMYYQGPLYTTPNVRPWSLHRNGHLGIAKWGGWMWSGDTESSWKTLKAQIAVGINHSLSVSPFWGSDIGGFFPNEELNGELYARWFQFGAFCPSFRSHGRTWWTRLPWGWGLSEMGPKEGRENPLESALRNPDIEGICRKFAKLRYRLLSYNYTLAWEARSKGLPMMRPLWLHYPQDEAASGMGDQYLWGKAMLVAPVYENGASCRKVYLPEGIWYDWWNSKVYQGKTIIERNVDLSIMPIFIGAGSIIPFDPLRQYTSQKVEEPLEIKVYRGADGSFILYEDDGIGLDYLDDTNTWYTEFIWDDNAELLTIQPWRERAPGSLKTGKFRITVIPTSETKTVQYRGKPIQESFQSSKGDVNK